MYRFHWRVGYYLLDLVNCYLTILFHSRQCLKSLQSQQKANCCSYFDCSLLKLFSFNSLFVSFLLFERKSNSKKGHFCSVFFKKFKFKFLVEEAFWKRIFFKMISKKSVDALVSLGKAACLRTLPTKIIVVIKVTLRPLNLISWSFELKCDSIESRESRHPKERFE